ncbi:MAG: sigma-70 family RNA polymerase sigma factor [Planctomycetota bacterium]
MDEETAALALRARQGDRAAFGALYERYAGLVHGVLLSLVSVAEAQDLVQEVFLAALRRQGHLEDPGRFGAWIATIARNRGRDALRARREVEPLDAGAGSEPAAPAGHAAEADDAEEAARALEAVRSLPEAYREPLLLRLVEGLSGPEIANRTGMTHGSVRVNLCRGMKLLRERLAAEARSE